MTNNDVTLGARLLAKLRSGIALAFIRTFAARGIATVGSVTLVAVIGRFYGVSGVGVFALGQSLLLASSIFARYGMDGALMRFVGRDTQSADIPHYLWHACLRALLFSCLAAAVMFMTRNLWAQAFDEPKLAPQLVGFAVATPAFTLALILSGFMKAVRKPATSMLMQNGAISFVAAVIILLFIYLAPNNSNVTVGIAYGCGAWLVLTFGVWHSWLWFKHKYRPAVGAYQQPDLKGFNRLSSAMFVSSTFMLVLNVVSIWAAGFFLQAAAVGLFKAAQQISNLIRIIIVVSNAIFPPRFAALYHQGKALAGTVRRNVLFCLALALAPTLVCLLAPEVVLGLFGKDFERAELLLRILAIAQFVNIGCGSVGYLLNMSSHERIVRNTDLVVNISSCVFILSTTPLWGIIAVAFGVALNFVTRKLIYTYFVWNKLGIWAQPVPNPLRLT